MFTHHVSLVSWRKCAAGSCFALYVLGGTGLANPLSVKQCRWVEAGVE